MLIAMTHQIYRLHHGVCMEDILYAVMDHALRCGAEYAEVRHQSDRYTRSLVKNGITEVSSSEYGSGYSVRVLADGCMAFGAGNGLDSASLRELAERTVRAARASSRLSGGIAMDESKVVESKDILNPRINFNDIGQDERESFLLEAYRAAAGALDEFDSRLAGCYLSLSLLETEKHIVNSHGGRLHSVTPRVSMNAFITVLDPEKGAVQRHISKGCASGWEGVEAWDLPLRMAEETTVLGKVLRDASSFRSGKKDLILGPEIIGLVAHESAGHPSEADRLQGREAAQAGETFLSDKGHPRRVGRELLNVVDDPTLPGSFGHYLHDDECIPARRRYLIRGGEFDELLHNRSTAAASGTLSNGSSRSLSYDMEPIVRMANTFVEPGEWSLEEMIEDIKDGIYMKTFMEWNIDDRRFNQRYVGLESYSIVNGEIAGMVRSPALEISTPGLWSAIDALGKEMEFSSALCGKGEPMQGIPVWTGGPDARLRAVPMEGVE